MCVHLTLCMICMMIGSYCFFCFELHTAICLCSFILPGVPPPGLSHLANLTTADPTRPIPLRLTRLRPIPLGPIPLGPIPLRPIPLADPTNPRAARLAVFSGAHKYKNLVLDQYIRDFSLAFGVPPVKPGGRSGAEIKPDASAVPSIEKKVS